MRRRGRVAVLLWPVLFMAGGGSLLPASAAARSAAASRPSAPCRAPRSHASRCLTIAAAPNPSTAGQQVTISGRLRGPRRAHALVLLWRRLPHSKHFHATAGTRTDRSGDYSMKVFVDGNRWWYVTARG